jgi:hypothetical protein
MATYTVSAGTVGVYVKTLVASTVDTVTFTDDISGIELGTSDGSAAIYFTVDGSTPTVGGANCYMIPAAANAYRTIFDSSFAQVGNVVKLISSGTPTYWVARA